MIRFQKGLDLENCSAPHPACTPIVGLHSYSAPRETGNFLDASRASSGLLTPLFININMQQGLAVHIFPWRLEHKELKEGIHAPVSSGSSPEVLLAGQKKFKQIQGLHCSKDCSMLSGWVTPCHVVI